MEAALRTGGRKWSQEQDDALFSRGIESGAYGATSVRLGHGVKFGMREDGLYVRVDKEPEYALGKLIGMVSMITLLLSMKLYGLPSRLAKTVEDASFPEDSLSSLFKDRQWVLPYFAYSSNNVIEEVLMNAARHNLHVRSSGSLASVIAHFLVVLDREEDVVLTAYGDVSKWERRKPQQLRGIWSAHVGGSTISIGSAGKTHFLLDKELICDRCKDSRPLAQVVRGEIPPFIATTGSRQDRFPRGELGEDVQNYIKNLEDWVILREPSIQLDQFCGGRDHAVRLGNRLMDRHVTTRNTGALRIATYNINLVKNRSVRSDIIAICNAFKPDVLILSESKKFRMIS